MQGTTSKNECIREELSLIHMNVRSIRNKFDEKLDCLKSLKLNFSVIGLTETWLTDNCANLYGISGYKLLTLNRKSKPDADIGIYIAE